MKNLIDKSSTYISKIGKSLYVEKFDDGSAFYCLMDKYNDFNVADTGKTYDEIKVRIDLWSDLIDRHVIEVR